MGSNPSSQKKIHQDTSQYGQLYLETDQITYHPGDTVTGKIFLNLISQYPGNQLFLEFRGREAVHLTDTKTTGQYSQYVLYSEKKDIIKKTTLVHSWDSLLSAQFTIPFSFLLPQTLPNSFYQQGPRYSAVIEYQLEAFLQPDQNTVPKMRYKQPINLREVRIQKTENISSHLITPLTIWWCCGRGSNDLKVNWEKNYYSPGENAKVSIVLDNSKSQLPNLEVIFSLKQELEVRAEGITLTYDLTKVQHRGGGVPPGSKRGGSVNITLPRLTTCDDFDRKIQRKPEIGALRGLQEKDLITSDTNSSLITSKFFLEVVCPMDDCISPLPLVKLPIEVLLPDSTVPAVNAPDNWHPETLENVALVFPSDAHQPLLYEEKNARVGEVNMEMVQISAPNHKQK